MGTPVLNTGCLCARNWAILTAQPAALETNSPEEGKFTHNPLSFCLDTVIPILGVWEPFESVQISEGRYQVLTDPSPGPSRSSVSF